MASEPAPAAGPRQENGSRAKQAARGGRSSSQKQRTYLPDVHRALPASLDAEKGVLGSLLLSPDLVIDLCLSKRVDSGHFHLPAHAALFEAAKQMRDAGKPIDMISVTQFLEDARTLEEVGGAGALADLLQFVPTAANAGYYIDIVRDKHLLRRIISTCNELSVRAYEEQGAVEKLLDEAEERVLRIGGDHVEHRAKSIKEITMQALDRIEAICRNTGEVTGLATGFSILDKMTDGLHPGEMFVLAARPSMGKTALAMNIAENAALDGKKVAVFSLEMSDEQLVQRMLCSMARVDLRAMQQTAHSGSRQDMDRLIAAVNKLSACAIYIDDTPALPILALRSRCRRLHEKHGGLDLVVIDYLQLVHPSLKQSRDNRQAEVAEISAGIKALAKELKVPIVALAQLNRNPDSRPGSAKGKPKLGDLRESGAIEQDADVVALLYREECYLEEEEEKKEAEGKAELIIAKQRNGPTGDVPLSFLKNYTRFENRASGRD